MQEEYHQKPWVETVLILVFFPLINKRDLTIFQIVQEFLEPPKLQRIKQSC